MENCEAEIETCGATSVESMTVDVGSETKLAARSLSLARHLCRNSAKRSLPKAETVGSVSKPSVMTSFAAWI